MTRLCIYDEREPRTPRASLTSLAEISRVLAAIGAKFDRWSIAADLESGAAGERALELYAEPSARLSREHGYSAVDVVSMAPDHPERDALRAKFCREHSHGEDEVRFFAEGGGLFCMHVGSAVYALRCERGDLLSVPAGVRHWFDMGSRPSFIALRFFENPAGWVPQFTGADPARDFPGFDVLAASAKDRAVLLDIEGTLSPLEFVQGTLFPYALQRLPSVLRERRGDPRVRAALERLRAVVPVDVDDDGAVLEQLAAWQARDVKARPLKELQGIAWEDGYRTGELVAPLYSDARARLRDWHHAGVPLVVYSSGSVHAQQLFFQHTSAGDVRGWFAAHHDTSTGSKLDPASYVAIARGLEREPRALLFLSDSSAELEAARAAGVETCWIQRGSAAPPLANGAVSSAAHPRASTFFDVAP